MLLMFTSPTCRIRAAGIRQHNTKISADTRAKRHNARDEPARIPFSHETRLLLATSPGESRQQARAMTSKQYRSTCPASVSMVTVTTERASMAMSLVLTHT